MKTTFATVGLLCFLLAENTALSQSVNGTIGGIVQDQSKALIPGVSITLANSDTGITASAVSNESGAYTFLSVAPGTYTVSAILPGFKTAVRTSVQVGTSAQVRIDFNMEVGAVASKVEVTAEAESALLESSASVGDVLPEYRIRNLPLVGNNVLDLLEILPGLRISPLGNASNTIGGLGMDSINTTRDGLSITDGRYSSQTYGTAVFSPTTINPDLVGEIRLILAPVDAELGRGNAQIQIQTRSGTNRYTGSAVWNIQNTALNANTWGNNNDTLNGVWTPTKPDWRNTNQFTVSYGGPIIRNRMFFFALWDQNINNTRELQSNNVLTDSARQGIFRYFTGWNPNNAQGVPTATPTTSTNPSYPAVDDLGRAVAPLVNPDGSPYTGGLRCLSVFGSMKVDGSPFTAADCPGGMAVTGTVWDPFRTTFDSTGYIKKILDLMPHANYFRSGDGLNQAQFRWLRGRNGSNSTNAIVGSDAYSNRKQINLKIDQNFRTHRISGSWSYQLDDSADNVSQWPGGLSGTIRRRPNVLTINGTSTLSSTLLNEARFGMNRNRTDTLPAWLHPNDQVREAAEALLLAGGKHANGNVYPVVLNPTAGVYGYGPMSNGYMAPAPSQIGNTTPLYNFADTVSWTRGRHAFKFGADLRLPRSNGYNIQPYPTVTMGNNAAATSTVSALNTLSNFATELPLFRQTARGNVTNMLYFLSGSVASATHQYWIENSEDVKNGTWQDTATKGARYREQVRTEYSAFVKDDFKLTKRLTLNLGLRYEFYASPYMRSGLTSATVSLGDGMFGASRGAGGRLFDDWLAPGNLYLTGYGTGATSPLSCATGISQSPVLPVSTCDPKLQTLIEFVGPNTPNPGKVAIPLDRNNFGPAVGFAWQVPWFGAGKTSVRGGYQITFGSAGRDGITTDTLLGSAPGNALTATTGVTDAAFSAILANRALNLTDIPVLVPVRPVRAPGATVPIYGRSLAYTAYDPNFATPYTQNLTLSVTRSVRRNTTLDVRYVGTLARKQSGNLNLNESTVFYNKELFDALVLTRAGGDAPLFDQMFAGLNLNAGIAGYGSVGSLVNGVLQTGSAHMRRSTTFAANLANGNLEAVANSIATLNPAGLVALPAGMTGVMQRALRNGCDRLANGLIAIGPGNSNPTRCFPENYLVANPQFTTAQYNANLGHSNYHSMQVQFSARPLQGINFQGTYSWAKSMEQPGSNFTDPLNRDLDYARGRQGPHSIRANGTFELPIGPNKLLFPGASGWFARAIERWQTSVIFNGATGSPADILGAGAMRYGNGRMVVASPDWRIPKGHMEWNGPNNSTGTFYGNPSLYVSLLDPQCNSSLVGATDSMGYNLRANCTLDALGLIVPAGTPGAISLPGGRSAVVALQNATPGGVGTLGARTLNYFGQWSLDASASKTFRVTESRSVQVRVDTRNVMNHPVPGIPSFTMDTLGQITTKSGSRTFQGQLRLNF